MKLGPLDYLLIICAPLIIVVFFVGMAVIDGARWAFKKGSQWKT